MCRSAVKRKRAAWRLLILRFLNLGGLTAEVAQVVQLGTTNLTTTHYGDGIHTRGVQRESTLNTYAVRVTTDGEGLTDGTVATSDDHAFKSLQTLTGTFDNLHLYANGVANLERRNISFIGIVLLPYKDVHNRKTVRQRTARIHPIIIP